MRICKHDLGGLLLQMNVSWQVPHCFLNFLNFLNWKDWGSTLSWVLKILSWWLVLIQAHQTLSVKMETKGMKEVRYVASLLSSNFWNRWMDIDMDGGTCQVDMWISQCTPYSQWWSVRHLQISSCLNALCLCAGRSTEARGSMEEGTQGEVSSSQAPAACNHSCHPW